MTEAPKIFVRPFAPVATEPHTCDTCGEIIYSGDAFYCIEFEDGEQPVKDHLDCNLASIYLTEELFGPDEAIKTLDELLTAAAMTTRQTLLAKFPAVAARVGITTRHTAN